MVIPIPKKSVLESEKREILVTYVHKNNKDKHCLVFEIDREFNILLPKAVDVVIETVTTPRSKTEIIEPNSSNLRYVIITCDTCNENIHVPIPKKIIERSKIPKTPVAYVHKNKNKGDPHSVILYLDRDYGDRDTRFPDILILYLFPYWLKKKYYFTS